MNSRILPSLFAFAVSIVLSQAQDVVVPQSGVKVREETKQTETAPTQAQAAAAKSSDKPPQALSTDKLTDPVRVLGGFKDGITRVIVNLAPPPGQARPDFKSKESRSGWRAAIRRQQEQAIATLPAADVHMGHRFDNIAGFSAEVTEQGLRALQANPRVASIEPVFDVEAHLAQGIALIKGMTYRSTYNGAGMSIAICDTGIDYNHARLGGGGFPNSKVLGGYDFGDSDSNPIPNGQAHGTCCAGIAAGDLGTVGDYIGGVAYNSKLYALKISSGSTGSASTAAMVAAWDWCVTHQNDNPSFPIMVISTSFGGGRYFATCDNITPSMTTAANNAVAAGITVLASSGNEGYCDSMGWPACISSVISVGAVYDAAFGTYTPCVNSASCAPKIATGGCSSGWYVADPTAADRVTAYANVASFLTVLAPAERCYTLDISGASGYSGGDYFTDFGGTSAACPYAAGAVAALQSAAKAVTGSFLSAAEVRSRLISSGDLRTDTKVAITKPRVNLERAIQSLAPSPSLVMVSATLSGGNGDQIVDLTECNDLTVLIRNDGNLTASNITATLTAAVAGLSILQAASSYTDLAPGTSAANATAFRLSSTAAFACGTPVNLLLTLVYPGGTNVIPFSLTTGATNYTISTSSGASIVPGITDTGNHGDDVTTAITLPFAYTFYGQTFTTASVSANGSLQFGGANSDYNNICLPAAAFPASIFAFWDDLITDGSVAPTQGIFTSTTGSAPNRIFNIEWRASYYAGGGNGSPVNFEIRLYEGQLRFDIVYGILNGTGTSATVGAQKNAGASHVQYSCNAGTLSSGLQLAFQQTCASGPGPCAIFAAGFTGSPTNGPAPMTVTFTNTSAGATNYFWSFGDGDTSTGTNVTHTYTNAGSYTVSLTAIGEAGTNLLIRTNYIVVTNVPPVVANFSASPTQGGAPLAVNFSNLSTGATGYTWSFGDGNTSTAAGPANTYSNAGSYTVTLTATGPAGTNALVRTNYIVVTNVPPAIVTHPQSQIVSAGDNATFTVVATGSPTLAYQWRLDGAEIDGATASAYTMVSVQLANAGNYSVEVTNLAGGVLSAIATLEVTPVPGFIPVTGAAYSQNFDSMGAEGTNTPFGWYIGNGTGAVSNKTVAVGDGSSAAGGHYNFGTTGANDRALGTLASSLTQRNLEARFVNISGAYISAFNVSYSGEQWRVGGTGAANNDLIMQYGSDGSTFAAMGAAFDFDTPLDSGSAGPLDGNDPTNRVTGIGGTYTPATMLSPGEVFYLRWADADSASADHAMAVDDLLITFTLTNPPPVITSNPLSQAVNQGDEAAFSVVAAGLMPLGYQWRFNGEDVGGATQDHFTVTNVQPAHAGAYDVVVTNIGGSANSSMALLTVNLPPMITNQPVSLIVAQGDNASFVVGADGSSPLGYQWRLNGADLAGFTIQVLTLSNVQPAVGGSYDVVVSNVAGMVTSDVATLTIILPPPIPDFTSDTTNGFAPLTVNFTNLTSGTATDYLWNFGDGNSSTNEHSFNTYSNAGSYTVTLTAAGPGGTNTLTATNYVTVTNLPAAPVVDFTADPVEGLAPLTVSFTNLTTGVVTAYEWGFGDGNASTNEHPSNTYSNAGSYTVTLTASGPGGSNTLTATNFVTVTNLPAAPVVHFTADTTNGYAPLTVTFTNLTVGVVTGLEWVFGNGSKSTNGKPSNTYLNAGNYTVSLTAAGPGGTNSLTIPNYIVVTKTPSAPLAAFIADSTTGLAPLTVNFSNLTAGSVTNYSWNFGDGNTSTNEEPSNTYSNAGSYTVSLTAVGPAGSNTLTATDYITVTNLPPPVQLVSPGALDFGLMPTGAVTELWFVISNAGGSTLSAMATVGGGPFSIVDDSSNTVASLGFALPAPGSTNLVLRFAPLTEGVFSNIVVFAGNGGDATNIVFGKAATAPVLLTQSETGGEFVFAFVTVNGLAYVVQYKDLIDDPLWQTLQTVVGDGSLMNITNSASTNAQRFFRLSVE